MNILQSIAAVLMAPLLFIGSLFEPEPIVITQLPTETLTEQDQNLGGFNTVGGKTYYLDGGGIGSTDTSITLTAFTLPVTGDNLTMTNFGDIGYVTIEPGSSSNQEFVSFTGVTQNSDGSATLTGVTRGLLPISPYTASTSYQKAHYGGATVVISNPPQLYEQFGALSNDEVITGNWTAPTPTGTSSIATRGYVLNSITTGNIKTDGVAVTAVAGETFATGTVVYFDTTQQEWMKASAAVVASSTNVQLGMAQGPGTDGSIISGGVVIRGVDGTQSGGTAGQVIYLSDTAGATSTSAGTNNVIIGVMRSATDLYFDPVVQNMAGLNYANTFSATTTFSGNVSFTGYASGISSSTIRYYTSTGASTWSKPATSTGFKHITIEVVGAGGGGGDSAGVSAGDAGNGGGSGAYCFEHLSATELAATSTIGFYVGVGGNPGTTGSTGSTTYFGTYCSSTGGTGGGASTPGTGGTATGGDLNVTGSEGGAEGYIASGWGAGGVIGRFGKSYGCGGRGGASAGPGGTACSGIIIVTEYY